ncbi:MAG: acetate--CoA ligase family protein [Thermoplasmata archaeon]|nr:acetate--CoA ligase family protein [Thermoplasmata archaeon]
MRSGRSDLDKLFNPGSVTVIGASAKEGSIGFSLIQNLQASGYAGEIFPVNHKYDDILGIRCYRTLEELPHPADLTVVAVPAEAVNGVVETACLAGARMFIIISSGFDEVGRHDLTHELLAVLKKHGARALGPNVFGVFCAKSSMNATFGPPQIRKGNVGLISQSGALGVALMGKSVTDSIGLSAVVSVGNEADISEGEALEYLGNDEGTEVIFMYMEGCREGRLFLDVASRVSRKKPIIIIKSGSSSRGALAAASHTGSLAGSDRVFSAAIRQAGVIRANDLTDAFNWTRALANLPLPEKTGTVIVTNGGGVGVMASDSAERHDVILNDDLEMLERIFRPTMPKFGSSKNPIDVTGQARNEEYGLALRASLEEDTIPSVVGLYCTPATMDVTRFAETAIKSTGELTGKKPFVFSIIGGSGVAEAINMLNAHNIPCYATPDEAMSSMGVLYRRWRWLGKEPAEPEKFDIDLGRIREIIDAAHGRNQSQLLESDCAEILRIAGLDFPKTAVAHSLNEALESAEKIGYPVVMKILSEDIIHKTEYGCVRLDLEDADEVRVAYETIMAEARRHFPKARIEGVTVTEMVKDATEMILGFSVDPSFGPVIMFGMGGIYVEVLKDVSFRVAPISRQECESMVKEINSYPVLAGARGKAFRDIPKAVDAISRISFIAANVSDILELDINPLMVMAKGHGCKVVDSRMTIRKNNINTVPDRGVHP